MYINKYIYAKITHHLDSHAYKFHTEI
jgi:hypothetical protein